MTLPLGEEFGAALVASGRPLACRCEPGSEAAAREYLDRVGAGAAELEVCDRLPLAELEAAEGGAAIPLVVTPVLDRELKDHFFHHPGLHLFADHHYVARPGHESPALFAIGTSAGAMAWLAAAVPPSRRTAGAARRRAADRAGDGARGHARLAAAMSSPAVHRVRVHGLGPDGTNIARACRTLAAGLPPGLAEVIVHGRKVEPRDYARIAAGEARPGVLPLHVECAVFYGLCDLFDERPGEVVLAGHLYLTLDAMQIACRPERAGGALDGRAMVLASHPSPLGLASRLLDAGIARHRPASSNSDAAEMVRLGEADLCITTETAARLAGLFTLHRFGSPTMLFTIGASVDGATLDALASSRQRSAPPRPTALG